jgi:DNA-binding MarR family transcriptional regulator
MTTARHQARQTQLNGARGMAEWVTICQAYNAVSKVIESALLPHGVSLPQFHLLNVLENRGGTLTTGEIARAMLKTSQGTTGLVDRLERPGLVERVFDRSDRRKTWVRMTEKGERKLREALPAANRLVEQISTVLSDQQLHELNANVEKLRAAASNQLGASHDVGVADADIDSPLVSCGPSH